MLKPPSVAKQMVDLFPASMRAHATYNPDPSTHTTGENGKLEVKYWTVHQPVTLSLWEQHLAGTYPLVLGLACDDGTASVSADDVDQYNMGDMDCVAILKKIEELKLPLYVARTKSMGARVVGFHDVPIPKAEATKVAEGMARLLGLKKEKVEFFPKPQNPNSKKLPRGLNMPYLGGAYGFLRPPMGGEMLPDEFLRKVVRLTAEQRAEIIKTPTPKPQPKPTSVDEGRKYALRMLRQYENELRNTSQGEGEGRNELLYKCAVHMGNMVPRGWIEREEIKKAFKAVIESERWNELPKTLDTLERAISDGEKEPHDDLYNLEKYFKKDGSIFWKRFDKDPMRLANFTAAIIKDVKVDDGSGQDKRQFTIKYVIAGRHGTARVAAEQFDGLSWVTRELGADACITPGQLVRAHLGNAIKSMDIDNRERGTVYAHLGWREIDGQWLYLHAAGAIGASGPVDGYTVEPGGELSRFALPTVAVADPCGALRASFRMLDMAGGPITWPLLAAVYLAPLGEFVPITESLFFTGGTGVRKSALQSVALGHWCWEQGGKKLPANWSSTANALEAMAFRAKDVLLVIDDFCPRGTTTEQQRQHYTAERLFRGQGNQSGRGRMNADGSQRTEMYPRGMLAASGEDTPSGHSIRARLVICGISPEDANLGVLTEMQKVAGTGVLKAAMADYVRFVAGQDKSSFQRRVTELRAEAVKRLSNGHTRTPENVALLMLGVENLFAWAASIGAKLDAEKLKGEAWEALLTVGQEQDQHQREEQPHEKFIVLLQGLLSSGRAHIRDAKKESPPMDAGMLGWIVREYDDKTSLQPGGHAIGWIDGDDLLLDPAPTFAALQQFAQQQGHPLALSQNTLWKRLYEADKLVSWEKGHHTIKKSIGRQRPRVLHLKMRDILQIDPAPPDAF